MVSWKLLCLIMCLLILVIVFKWRYCVVAVVVVIVVMLLFVVIYLLNDAIWWNILHSRLLRLMNAVVVTSR